MAGKINELEKTINVLMDKAGIDATQVDEIIKENNKQDPPTS